MRYRLTVSPTSPPETVAAELSRLLTHTRGFTISTVMVGPPYKPLAYHAWVLDVPDSHAELVSTRVLPLIVGTEEGFQPIQPIPHRPEWSHRVLLAPTASAESLADIAALGWASACIHLRWTPGRCGGLVLYSPEDAQHLRTIAAKGWNVSALPALLARRPWRQRAYAGSPWLGGPTTAIPPGTRQAEPPPLPVDNADTTVDAGAAQFCATQSALLAAAGEPGVLLGATLDGHSVSLAWGTVEIAIDGPLQRQRGAVLALIGRAFDQGLGVLAILPRPMVADGALRAWSERLCLLDSRDRIESPAIAWPAIDPVMLRTVLAQAGMRKPLPDPLPTSFAELLAKVGLPSLATEGVKTLTARPGDDLAGTLAQGGGVILLDSGEPEIDLLSNLLLAACSPAGRGQRALLVIRPNHISLPSTLARRSIEVVLGPSPSALGVLHAEAGAWRLRLIDGTPDLLLQEDLNIEPSQLDASTHSSIERLDHPADRAALTPDTATTDNADDWYSGLPTARRPFEPVAAGVDEATSFAYTDIRPPATGDDDGFALDPAIGIDGGFPGATFTPVAAPDIAPNAPDEWSSLAGALDDALNVDSRQATGDDQPPDVISSGAALAGVTVGVADALLAGQSYDVVNIRDTLPLDTVHISDEDPALLAEMSWPATIDDTTVMSDDGIDLLGAVPALGTEPGAVTELVPLSDWDVTLDDDLPSTGPQDNEYELLDWALDPDDATTQAPPLDTTTAFESAHITAAATDATIVELPVDLTADEFNDPSSQTMDRPQIEEPVFTHIPLTGTGTTAAQETWHCLTLEPAATHAEIIVLDLPDTVDPKTLFAGSAADKICAKAVPVPTLVITPDLMGTFPTGGADAAPVPLDVAHITAEAEQRTAPPTYSFADRRSGIDRRIVVRGRDRRRRPTPVIRYRNPAGPTVSPALQAHTHAVVAGPADDSAGQDVVEMRPGVERSRDKTVRPVADDGMIVVTDAQIAPSVAQGDVQEQASEPEPDANTTTSRDEIRVDDVVLEVELIWNAWRGGTSLPMLVRLIHAEQPHLQRTDIRDILNTLIDRLIVERLTPIVGTAEVRAADPAPVDNDGTTTTTSDEFAALDANTVSGHTDGSARRPAASDTLPLLVQNAPPLIILPDFQGEDEPIALSVELADRDEQAEELEHSLDHNDRIFLEAAYEGAAHGGGLAEDIPSAHIMPVRTDESPCDASGDGDTTATGATGLTPSSDDTAIWAAWEANMDMLAIVKDLCGFIKGVQATATRERIYQVVVPRVVAELDAWAVVDRVVTNRPVLKSQQALYEHLLRRLNRQQYNTGGFNRKKTHDRLVRIMRAELALRSGSAVAS